MCLTLNIVPRLVVYDMIDFVGTPPVLRIALRVAINHAFSHSQNRFHDFLNCCMHYGGSREQFCTNEKVS